MCKVKCDKSIIDDLNSVIVVIIWFFDNMKVKLLEFVVNIFEFDDFYYVIFLLFNGWFNYVILFSDNFEYEEFKCVGIEYVFFVEYVFVYVIYKKYEYLFDKLF